MNLLPASLQQYFARNSAAAAMFLVVVVGFLCLALQPVAPWLFKKYFVPKMLTTYKKHEFVAVEKALSTNPLYLMCSRNEKILPDVKAKLEKFNAGLKKLKENGELDKILAEYL